MVDGSTVTALLLFCVLTFTVCMLVPQSHQIRTRTPCTVCGWCGSSAVRRPSSPQRAHSWRGPSKAAASTTGRESGSEESESESESQSASESGSEESEEEEVLAAFSTSSARAPKGRATTASKLSYSAALAGSRQSCQGKEIKKPVRKEPAKPPKSSFLTSGRSKAKEVELCTDPDATLERHLEDTEKLLAAFEAVDKHEPLVEKAVELTIERCNARSVMQWRQPVAAVQAAEMRMEGELREAVMQQSRTPRSRPRRLNRSPFPRPCVLQRSAHWSSSASPSSRLPCASALFGKSG